MIRHPPCVTRTVPLVPYPTLFRSWRLGNGAGGSPKRTPLHDLHRELGGKMVPFAGYERPVQYPAGILKERLHTRARAGLFDVSHMGQLRIRGDAAAKAIESLVPGDIQGLAEGGMRYTQLTNDRGGIRDDQIGRAHV